MRALLGAAERRVARRPGFKAMNVERLVVRPARRSDADDLFPIIADFATSFVPERGAFERTLPRVLADENACLLVAELEARVTGYVLGFEHLTFFANGHVSWVEEIAVTASLRGKGIGRALMMGFEQWATSRRSPLIALATRRAAGFYLALGYEESATYFRKVL